MYRVIKTCMRGWARLIPPSIVYWIIVVRSRISNEATSLAKGRASSDFDAVLIELGWKADGGGQVLMVWLYVVYIIYWPLGACWLIRTTKANVYHSVSESFCMLSNSGVCRAGVVVVGRLVASNKKEDGGFRWRFEIWCMYALFVWAALHRTLGRSLNRRRHGAHLSHVGGSIFFDFCQVYLSTIRSLKERKT